MFISAMNTFKVGGYLVVDELENHFNHEIVSTIIRFYMDPKVNYTGATLVFSTHYPELLVVCNIYNLHKLICYGMIYSSCDMGVC